jgi:hypothetical protein
MRLVTRGALRGLQLQNGALAIESWQINADEHVVLAFREHPIDCFVVWTSDEFGNCFRGDYCSTIQEAISCAERRAGL